MPDSIDSNTQAQALQHALETHLAGLLTEPLTAIQLARYFQVNRNKMAQILKHMPGVEIVVRRYRVPLWKMPPDYLIERGILPSAESQRSPRRCQFEQVSARLPCRRWTDRHTFPAMIVQPLLTPHDAAALLRISITKLNRPPHSGSCPIRSRSQPSCKNSATSWSRDWPNVTARSPNYDSG
jgi:hypothetical protein